MFAKKFVFCVPALLLSFQMSAHGSEPNAQAAAAANDKVALAGLQEVKMVFDITTGDAKKLLGRLALIEETRDSVARQGATPRIALTFRGPASLLTQKDTSRIKPEDVETMLKVQDKIRAMSKDKDRGYQLAQCGVANRFQKIKNEDTISELPVVGNTFISLAAYQNKGYAYIPID